LGNENNKAVVQKSSAKLEKANRVVNKNKH